jgi:hypothetical protein
MHISLLQLTFLHHIKSRIVKNNKGISLLNLSSTDYKRMLMLTINLSSTDYKLHLMLILFACLFTNMLSHKYFGHDCKLVLLI